MNYLSIVKQIELEARFNQKLGHRELRVPVYFEYLPHKNTLNLICKAEISGKDRAFMCASEIGLPIITEENKVTIYDLEEKWLNQLYNIYMDRMNDLGSEL